MSAVGLANIKKSPYSPDLNMCVFIHQIAGTLQNATLSKHRRIENWRAAVFEVASEIFLRELEKLKGHCEDVVWQSGVYITP